MSWAAPAPDLIGSAAQHADFVAKAS